MEEDRLVAVLRAEAYRSVEALGMVGLVVLIERPEVLLVREQIHDLGRVRVARQRLESSNGLVERAGVAADVDFGEDGRVGRMPTASKGRPGPLRAHLSPRIARP